MKIADTIKGKTKLSNIEGVYYKEKEKFEDCDSSPGVISGIYLCIYRMNRAREDGRLPSREAVRELDALRSWAARTTDGDLSISSVVRVAAKGR